MRILSLLLLCIVPPVFAADRCAALLHLPQLVEHFISDKSDLPPGIEVEFAGKTASICIL